MKYLNLYNTMSGYTEASPTFPRPHVSYIVDEDLVIYDDVQPTDWSKKYLTFLALEDGTFTLKGINGLTTGTSSYSLDDGGTWAELAADTPTQTVTAGSKIMFKGSFGGMRGRPRLRVVSTGRFEAMGNPYSLCYGDDFGADTLSADKCPAELFSGCTGLTSAENLSLPATTLANYCYYSMFYGCTSLATAPELPATTLAEHCYMDMFSNCTSLATAPELTATTLAQDCYGDMFLGCTSLTTAPALPATTLADNCYGGMFIGCTSLTNAPALPATTLAQTCYYRMFNDCTSLTTAPELPATTLAQTCYNSMFQGCTSLHYVKMLATDVSATNCLSNWLDGVSPTGTFVKHPNANLPSGASGIPAGWTVETATE